MASSTTFDPDTTNNEGAARTTVSNEADLRVEKTADATIKIGEVLTYTITVTNNGPSNAKAVGITDILPLGMANAQYSTNGGTDWSNYISQGTITLGDIDYQSSVTVLIRGTVTASDSTVLENKAIVSAETADPNQNNDEDIARTTAISIAASDEADLRVEKTADATIKTGEVLTYTITVTNDGPSNAKAVGIADILPLGLANAQYSTNGGTDWSNYVSQGTIGLGDIDHQSSATVLIRGMVTAADSTVLENKAIVSAETADPNQNNNEDTARTTAISIIASDKADLRVKKTADATTKTGEILTYTITVTNDGPNTAKDTKINDKLPDGLEDVQYSLDKGDNWIEFPSIGTISLGDINNQCSVMVLVRGKVTAAEGAILNNQATVSSETTDPNPNDNIDAATTISNGVANAMTFSVTKTSDKIAYYPGEEITYTIKVCNYPGLPPLDDVIVKDIFRYPKSVEIVASYPEPNDDGIWHFSRIEPGSCVEIVVVARTPIVKTKFDLEQSVDGSGFVNVNNDVSTEVGPYIVDNCVYVTARIDDIKVTNSTCTAVTIGETGTELSTVEHGSGDYSSEEKTTLKWENRSIKSVKNVSASYSPKTFVLPGNNDLNYASKWTEESRAKNHITGTVMHETYRYATNVDRNSYAKMDENGSKMMVDSSFNGKGRIGFFKKASPGDGPKNKPIFESQEDYSGQFSINESFDEYGRNVVNLKAASGEGFVSADKRIRSSQRTYESGTGSYRSEEIIDSFSNYMAKNIEVAHRPSSYNYSPAIQAKQDMKWNEGMWSKSGLLRGGDIFAGKDASGGAIEKSCASNSSSGTGPANLISERYSSLEHLKKDSVALGLNEMKTNATFSGVADFRSTSLGMNGTDRVGYEERYAGNYSLTRHILMTGVSRYDYPHITVTKEGEMKYGLFNRTNSTIAEYNITITNDGNRALAPIYVQDRFPPGTEYISSSVRPTTLSAKEANWTVLHLGIGNSLTLNLKLNITDYAPDNVVNCVVASGVTGSSLVSSSNCTSLDSNWLGCCQGKVFVDKQAYLDPSDPTVVHYTITIGSDARSTWTAEVLDRIPGDMKLLRSAIEPYSVDSNYIRWNFASLLPGEIKTIEYSMQAARNGAYTNNVHVNTNEIDGSGSASADASAFIDLRNTGVAPRTVRYDGWQPPDWDLNTSDEGMSI
jgi:uncharacterized repeat protein (TIGR01451 family)